ncbi:unnamed protein product [Danaus chrysippus]|uniref:(African queen) hypothetical protein n=1 Tax=Danaus chrysippus TaxID=151541 RepID=A0A8J2R0Q1_9NEOP|nr:unnamed protein product [Danaus chrysippus]
MGIKGLWTVLGPYSEKISLHEISGQTVAIDLAGWVCDSQNVTDYYIQPKLYLRNLFFRTLYLVLSDVNPIFVLEGDAPELKRDVMAARNTLQFKGAAPKATTEKKKQTNITRSRFKGVLKELVDAVVSQDSDCFAYGAKKVYRNFSVSNAGGGGATQGSVDVYDAVKMFNNNGFGRNKMVALALLCGSDYGLGACGSSKTTVVSFLHTVSEDQVISRLLSWVSDPQHYEQQSRWVSVPGRCDRCGHAGRTHLKKGCATCATHQGCNDTGHKSKLCDVKRELSLRNKALSSGIPFPEPKVMKEFLNSTPEDIDLDRLKIPKPSLIQFVKIMSYKLDWPQRYCVEKFLPLLTKWHLQDNVPSRTLRPLEIRKKRHPKGVPSYEVVWGDIDGHYEGLIPDEQLEEEEDISVPWVTIERQDLMLKYYPDIVKKYEESIKKPPKEKKTRGRKKKEENENSEEVHKTKRKYTRKPKPITDFMITLNRSMKNLSLTKKDTELNSSKVSVNVNKLKRKIKNNGKVNTKNTIESYLKPCKKKKSSSMMRSINRSRNVSKSFKVNLENKENMEPKKHLLSMFNDSTSDVEANDLSDIVEKIVSRSAPSTKAKVDSNFVKLIFENKLDRKSILTRRFDQNNCSTPISSPIRKSRNRRKTSKTSISEAVDTSYFFDKLTEERDAFELSLEFFQNLDSLPKVEL